MEQQVRKKRKVKVVPKKKSRKKLWIVLGSILSVLLIAAGTLYYFLALKEYDIADTEVEEIVREPYRIELPDGSVIEIDEAGNVIEDGEQDSSDTASAEGTTTDTSSDSSSASGENDEADGNTSSGSSQGSSGGTTGSGSGSTSGGSGSSGSGSSSGSNGGGSTGGTSGGSGSTGGSGNGSGSTDGGKVTVAQITSKYAPTFAALEGQADAKLDALIGRAKSEYVSKEESGEGISYAYFFNKYSSAARELEANTDGAFYAVLGAVKNELQKNGFSTGYTDSFVSEYEARKAERRNSILSQVR